MAELDGSIHPREALDTYADPVPAISAWIARQIDVEGVDAEDVAAQLEELAAEFPGSPTDSGLSSWAAGLRRGERPDLGGDVTGNP